MEKLRDLLMGRKTYIVSVFLAGYAVLKVFNIINTSPEQDQAVVVLFGAILGITLSAKINRKL